MGTEYALATTFILILVAYAYIALIAPKTAKDAKRVWGVTFKGPLPNENSLTEVLRWANEAISKQYGPQATKATLSKLTITFVNDISLLMRKRDTVFYNDDARKTELARVICVAAILKQQPDIQAGDLMAKYRKVLADHPQDYY